jgi:hypothetical protein
MKVWGLKKCAGVFFGVWWVFYFCGIDMYYEKI